MRVALYARVSTTKEQKPEIQIAELRSYSERRGWVIVEELIDHGYSGKSDKRPGLDKLLSLVRAGKLDGVVVTKLDRLFRSLQHLTAMLAEFAELGVCFTAANDQIDMSTASGKLMAHLIGAFAEFEHSLICERTRMGMDFARKNGKKFGRPKIHDEAKIIELRQAGKSYRQIEQELKIPLGVVSRAIRSETLRLKNSAAG